MRFICIDSRDIDSSNKKKLFGNMTDLPYHIIDKLSDFLHCVLLKLTGTQLIAARSVISCNGKPAIMFFFLILLVSTLVSIAFTKLNSCIKSIKT